MDRNEVLGRLLRSAEPSIRWKARAGVRGEDPESRSMRRLRMEVARAPRSRALLREARRPGPGHRVWGVYRKWVGDHWAVAALADLGYPPGDTAVRPALERVVDFWLRPNYFREFDATTEATSLAHPDAVPRIRLRYRRCASQQGNALFAATTLGLDSEAEGRLAERLRHWQWPDGGWNCDRNPAADTSSFEETLTPMIGLNAYGTLRGHSPAREAARRASEVFLRRRLYRRVSDGRVMHGSYLARHYPLYYHYDVLGGLKAMDRLGRLADPRCADALDWLESEELASGGWNANRRYYDRPGDRARRGTDRVSWGAGGRVLNEWVSVDALTVLSHAGRYSPPV